MTPAAGTSKETPCRMCEPPTRTRRSLDLESERALTAPPPGRPPARSRSAITARRGVAGQQRAVVHHGDPVGQASTTSMWCSTISTVLPLLACSDADQLDQRRHVLGAHPGHRLVEQHHARVGRQQQGDLQLALLAVRRACRPATPPGGQADPVQHPARPLDAPRVRRRAPPEPQRAAALRLHGQPDVLAHGQRGEHAEVWKVRPEPEPGPPVRRTPR